MHGFSFDLLFNPVFWAAGGTSAAVLAAIRLCDSGAEKRERQAANVHVSRRNGRHFETRIRLGMTPVMDLGTPDRARLFNPAFLLTEVLFREPLSVLPFVFSGICWVFGELGLATESAMAGIIWRLVYDYFRGLPALPPGARARTALLKVIWCVAAGVWIAAVGYLVMAAVVALMVLLALLAGGGGKKRRRD